MTYTQGLPADVAPKQTVNNLASLLRSLEERTEGPTVSIGEMLDAIGRRAFGPVLLLLGFIGVSPLTVIPGATWLVAFLVLLIAGQILIGRPTPWLSSRITRIEFPREAMLKGVEAVEPYARFIDRFLKPRLAFLTETPFVQFVALVCIAAALITFPLGFVPLAPILPGLTIFFFGLALTARDGFVLVISALFLSAALWIGFQVAERILT